MAEPLMTNTGGDKPPSARLARAFASPGGVLVILPALVIAAGIAVSLLGRRATRETAENMARHQLVAQAKAVTQDVEFALDQATPVLATMKSLAVEAMPTPDALTRLHDAVLGRPGIWNASIAFPSGVMWGTYVEFSKDGKDKLIRVQESKVADDGVTTRVNYRVEAVPVETGKETNNYDPRQRPHYRVAVDNKKRTWMPPRVFSTSGRTGITVSEPVYGPDGSLQAVMTIDFDVESLSAFIRNPPIAGARNVMFTADGTILAYPENAMPTAAAAEKRLLHHSDFKDAALASLFKAGGAATGQRFLQLKTDSGDYFASIAVVGGKRAGTEGTLDWYLATLVPESTLFGAMKRLSRDAIIASGAALAIAMGVALMFAWNILRMRRTVSAAREAARSAELRAKQLGSYRLVERLGAGGMGEVWRAEHQLLARKAAIKLVRKDVVRDRQHAELIQERFRREAQVLASMRSRHTIELYDYGVTDDGTFFYVMELLEGLDLAVLVREYGPQPAARVIQIISQACQSLAEAHDAGLLHRDIKPANIELCRAADEVDIIKVLDFGIVHNISDPVSRPSPAIGGPDDVTMTPERASSPAIARTPLSNESGERLTTEGVVIGTPGYIPPEQAIAAPLHPRGDIYALACVAWYLLTGAEIYPRSTEEEILRAHVMEKIPTLRDKVRGWLPTELETLLLQCLAKEPDARPDARTLAKGLAKIAVPAEHAWTEEMAQTWWESLMQPAASESMAAATVPDGGRMLVPARATTQAAGSEPRDARTIEARPSSRTL